MGRECHDDDVDPVKVPASPRVSEIAERKYLVSLGVRSNASISDLFLFIFILCQVFDVT